jgi:hypothetical protein
VKRVALMAAIAVLVASLNVAPAAASQVRTFVSGHGADTGSCGVGSPCRTFAFAATQTAAGGEITVLDSAGYGAVTISQSLTITNPGGIEAGITAASGDAITVNTTAAANVTLRGLTLEGSAGGANGIVVNSPLPFNGGTSTLNIIGCVIKDFGDSGITVAPSSSGANGSVPALNALIADSYLLSNATAGVVFETPGATIEFVAVERTTTANNGVGIYFNQSAQLFGVLADIRALTNTTGVKILGGNALVLMQNSTALLNTSADVNITGGTIILLNHNQMTSLNNTSIAESDGTNYIDILQGNALNNVTLR